MGGASESVFFVGTPGFPDFGFFPYDAYNNAKSTD